MLSLFLFSCLAPRFKLSRLTFMRQDRSGGRSPLDALIHTSTFLTKHKKIGQRCVLSNSPEGLLFNRGNGRRMGVQQPNQMETNRRLLCLGKSGADESRAPTSVSVFLPRIPSAPEIGQWDSTGVTKAWLTSRALQLQAKCKCHLRRQVDKMSREAWKSVVLVANFST